MTKEEAIKKAYGDRYEELKSFICMNDGWCIECTKPNKGDGVIIEYIRAYDGDMVDVLRWMPKELKGIENNNGWIKIESDGSN